MTKEEIVEQLEKELIVSKMNRDMNRRLAESYNDEMISLKERIALIKRQ